MTDDLQVRAGRLDDVSSIEAVYRAALPDEDLLGLVQDLLRRAADVVSLVGVSHGVVVGHIALTRCGVGECDMVAALLAPLAVAPALHGQGIGSALVRAGLEIMARDGVEVVLVLGDPGYYGRFGFETECDIVPPYPLVAAWRTAWQSLRLAAGDRRYSGALRLPEPWMRPELWTPQGDR